MGGSGTSCPLAGEHGTVGPRGRGLRCARGPFRLPEPPAAGSPPRRPESLCPAGAPNSSPSSRARGLLTAQTPSKSLQRSPAAPIYSPLVFNDAK